MNLLPDSGNCCLTQKTVAWLGRASYILPNILLVDKSDKTKRCVLDFRNLNKNTKPDNYPLPNVEEMIEIC